MREYYYVLGQTRQGPVDLAQIESMIVSGTIRPHTLIWYEGLDEWILAEQLDELRPLFAENPSHLTLRYAGFFRRAVAFLIDMLTLLMPLLVFVWILLRLGFDPQELTVYGSDQNFIASMLCTFLVWLYFAICESSSVQGTFGKWVMGIKVTDMAGQKLGFFRAFARQIGRVFSSFLMIGYLMAAVTPQKQALHDMLANTLVIERSPRP